MRRLRKNSLVQFLFLTVVGCATSSYKVLRQTGAGTEILVSSNRVLVECEYQEGYDGEVKHPFGFMMHVLDEEKTVLNLIIQSVIEKDECLQHADATNKILHQSNIVHIGSYSPIDGPREKGEQSYVFPGIGTFKVNHRVLNFRGIWNENGQCYDVYYGTKKPCPQKEFVGQ